MVMKSRIPLLLMLSFCTLSCASAQMHSLTATVQQPAGSVVLPSAEPDSTNAPQHRAHPLYSSEDVLLYLPAPANLATYDASRDIIDVAILAPRLSKSSRYEVIPVGLMEFDGSSGIQHIIIAIPSDPSIQTIKSPSLEQLQLNYPGVVDILSIWFENAFSDRQTELVEIKDEQAAIKFLESLTDH